MLRFELLLCFVGLVVGGPTLAKTREEIDAFRQYLERSRQGTGIRLDSKALLDLQGNIWEHSGKFEGDIILDDWQIDEIVSNYATGRAAYIAPNTKWPNNIVIYQFANNAFNIFQRNIILNAMRLIESNSCVRFRERIASDHNYVLITGRSDGCYANVGYWPFRGVHTFNLATNGCIHSTVIVHEWLHILGFFHTQSTHNRDDYVRIEFNNIEKGTEHNFEKYNTNIVSNLDLPYEYTSCMHYSSHAFSRNGLPTIVPLRSFPGTMGQIEQVSNFDWLRLRRHYNCAGGWSQGAKNVDNERLIAVEPEEESGVNVAGEAR